ncbi:DUF5979 domain-containing protein [Gordonia sp. (in: high G+C Gram-positive bacteria)]|uniref:DUF5979 domain-containing protein n=1 Tax=Gordonia sp. (in: high G+C Gram-positive bacteria) TaxID=84139 RepID=UPI003C76DD8E
MTVPGHHLEGLTAPAVISDTFSDTLTVCEVTGDLRKDLNLKVTAKDIIGDESQNATRDLTATTGVTRTANGIGLTLPKDAGDYSRETVYTIEYTLCTSSGGLDQRGTVYSNSIDYADKKFSSKVTQEWGGGGTGEGASRGSFSLTKTIDRASVDVPEDTQFTVKVEEFAPGTFPKGPAASTYNIKVKADGTPVNGLNPRGNGWQIRLTEIDLPKVDGAYFEPGKFLPAPGVVLNAERTQALVSITPKSNVEVALVNKAAHGSAKVTKTVTGEAKDAGALTGMENFVFNAEIEYGDKDAGNELRTFTLKDGQFYDLKDLPIGAKVTITEVQPADTDRVSWSTPVVSKNPLVIGTDAAANAVSVTNEAKLTRGTFSLSKKLTGPESSNKNVPTGFEVLATWTDAAGKKQSKTLPLPADGTSVPFGQNPPSGTQVTLTEKVPANGNGLAWGVPAFSGDVTVGADDSGVVTIGKEPGKVTVTNFVDKNDGTLQIVKQVTGEAADKVGDGVEFKVLARWKDGADYRSKELTVKQGVSTPLGVDLPIGTEVTFSEIDRPQVEGVEWGQISWGTEPSGASWLTVGADGTATGIVSDDPKEGRLITLSNEALWQFGSVEFTKFVLDGDDPVPAGEAGLPKDTEFEVRIEGVDPALPKGTVFPAVGETITLNAANNWTFTSGDVLPRGTVVTFSEVDPDPLPGKDWARPYYFVTKDGGDEGYRNTVQIVPGQKAVVQIHNRPTPTAEVDIEKVVTGPKGRQVTKDPSALFQVTATWTDSDGEARSCVLNVKPGASATPTAKCEAAVVDGRPQFPLDTEITFTETGARTGVSNVKWGDVVWSVKSGSATMVQSDSEPNGVVVTLTGEANKKVELKLENKTSRDGLIILPLPIPLPGWPGGPGWPGWPGGPNGPGVNPGPNKPVGPNGPGSNGPGSNGPGSNGPGSNGPDSNGPGSDGPGSNGGTGHNGAPGQPAPQQPHQSQSLPVTGANVIWLGLGALVLIAGGGWLVLRNRRRAGSDG